MTLKKLDPMDEIADRADRFAMDCHAVSKRTGTDPNLLPHGLNSLVGALLDKGFRPADVEIALNDALKNAYLVSAKDAGVSR
ncbi:hypothetical protein BH09PSE1_BH09PSE1_13420 [soil metagenome]